MPTGKVRFFDSAKGYGFISGEDGQDVFFHASLVADEQLPAGARVEFAVAEGRRGPQALSLRVLSVPRRVSERSKPRLPADQLALIAEDLIKVLDEAGEKLKHGNYPERAQARKLSAMLHRFADYLER